MRLYLLRHGETDWNIECRLQGYTDVPLNLHGIAQAEESRKELQQRQLQFDAVYSSPLRRVLHTAEIVTDDQYDIILDDRLKERNFGDLEGQVVLSWESLGVDIFDFELNTAVFNIEPIKSFHGRVEDFIADLRKNHPADAKILIATSNGFIRRFRSIIESEKQAQGIGNAEIYECEL